MFFIWFWHVGEIFIDSFVVFSGTGLVMETGDLYSLRSHYSGTLHFIDPINLANIIKTVIGCHYFIKR